MAKIKLTKNELKIQKDALKMYKRYLPTLTLKKQQLQTEIRSIDAKAKEVRAKRVQLEKEFDEWISVFGETQAFKPGMVTVSNIKKGVGNIAGSYVLDGTIERGCKIRITREGKLVHEGDLGSLKRFKDDVKEVRTGYECGLVFDGFSDIQEFDIVEAYKMVEVPRKQF